MLDFTNILMLASLPICLCVSAFLAGTETVLFGLSRHDRKQLTRGNTVRANAIRQLTDDLRGLIVTILLGNMTMNVTYLSISTVLLLNLKEAKLHPLILAALSVVPVLMLILLGEVLPKLIASRLGFTLAPLVAVPMLVLHRAVGPVRLFLQRMVILPLARLFAVGDRPPELSAEELRALLQNSQSRGVINADEERLLRHILTFSQWKVRDVMRPRVDMEAFDLGDAPAALLELTRRTRLSRIPVYSGNVDQIEGYVTARQVLLQAPKSLAEIRKLMHQVTFVPDLQRADRLLVDMRRSGVTFVIAVDEYGGTAGLATLEDVVERLVGEIAGPYDTGVEPSVVELGHNHWRVSADLAISEWAEAFHLRHQDVEVNTVGGLVMARLGKLPRKGDKTVIGNLTIEVESMNGRRIESLVLRLNNAHVPEQALVEGASP